MKIKKLSILLCLGLILNNGELSAESYYDRLPSVELNLEVLNKFKKTARPEKPKITKTQPVSKPKPKVEPKPIEKITKPVLPAKPKLPVKPKAEPKPVQAPQMPPMPPEPKEEPQKTVEKPVFLQVPIKPKKEPKKEPRSIQKVETPPALPPKPELPAKPKEAAKPKEEIKPVKIADKPIGPVLPPKAKEAPKTEEKVPTITAQPKAKPKIEKPEPKMEPVELKDGKLPWKEEDDSQYQPKLTWGEDEQPKEETPKEEVAKAEEKDKKDLASVLDVTKPIAAPTPLPSLPGVEEVKKDKPKIPEVPNIYDEDGRKLALRIEFAQSQTGLSPSVENELQGLLERLKDKEDKVLIIRAYAGGNKEQASLARRVSLSRAVAVRSYLIDNELASSRINVRAMGNAYKEPPADRVDIFIDESDF